MNYTNNNTQVLEEDEIDLKELYNTILKYSYKIVLFTLSMCPCKCQIVE